MNNGAIDDESVQTNPYTRSSRWRYGTAGMAKARGMLMCGGWCHHLWYLYRIGSCVMAKPSWTSSADALVSLSNRNLGKSP